MIDLSPVQIFSSYRNKNKGKYKHKFLIGKLKINYLFTDA